MAADHGTELLQTFSRLARTPQSRMAQSLCLRLLSKLEMSPGLDISSNMKLNSRSLLSLDLAIISIQRQKSSITKQPTSFCQ